MFSFKMNNLSGGNLVPRASWRLRGHKPWKKTKPELQKSCSLFSQSAFTCKNLVVASRT